MTATLTTTPILLARHYDKELLSNLHDRFQSYVSRVRQMREQSSHLESSTIINTSRLLEEEIYNLKALYERELEELRAKHDAAVHERNQFQLAASKNGTLASELQDRISDEVANRKKGENAIADLQRVIAEKDALLSDLRIELTQHKNAHLDTKKDRDTLSSLLCETQNAYDVEAAAKGDFENLSGQLKAKLDFERQLHEKEVADLKARIEEAEHAIRLAEQRLGEHNLLDDNIAAVIARMRLQSEAEIRRFQEESELTFQTTVQNLRYQLENESKALAQALEENIHLKAKIDNLNGRLISIDDKCQSLEQQNQGLIQTLEVERNQATNTIKNLEAKLRELQDTLNAKIRELGLAYSSHYPLSVEMEALNAMLEAEEKRLNMASQSSLPQIIRTRTNLVTPKLSSPIITTSRPLTVGASTYGAKLLDKTGSTSPRKTRPKSTPPLVDIGKYPGVTTPITTSTAAPQSWTYVPNYGDYHPPTSSFTGNVKILEINPDGKYVRIFNTSTFQDEEIGGFIIQQNVGGRPITVFRFPPRTKIRAGTHITVWSASSMARHNPPSDFLWRDQYKWGTGAECTTILCKPNGQAVSWTTAAYPYGVPEPIKTSDEGPGRESPISPPPDSDPGKISAEDTKGETRPQSKMEAQLKQSEVVLNDYIPDTKTQPPLKLTKREDKITLPRLQAPKSQVVPASKPEQRMMVIGQAKRSNTVATERPMTTFSGLKLSRAQSLRKDFNSKSLPSDLGKRQSPIGNAHPSFKGSKYAPPVSCFRKRDEDKLEKLKQSNNQSFRRPMPKAGCHTGMVR